MATHLPQQFLASPQGAYSLAGIYYEQHGLPAGPTTPALVLLHGLAAGVPVWGPTIKILQNSYHLLVPELRGHGRSQGATAPESIAQMAADVWAIADACGLKNLYVLGHSMGGAVAQCMARQHPERVGGLVLFSTFACKEIVWRERLFSQLAVVGLKIWGVQRFAELNGVFGTGGKRATPAFIELIKRVFRTQTDANMIASSQAIFAFDSRPWLATLHMPVLILAGAKDRVMPVHHAFSLKEYLPQAQVYFCTNAGHALFSTHEGWFIYHLACFIKQHNQELTNGSAAFIAQQC